MKKISIFFILFLSLLSSCETDFEVNAEWEEIMVVYGLLDQSKDTNYIRINKAFLGKESADVIASFADSLNYDPNNLEVKLQRLSEDNIETAERILSDTIMYKEDGMFATDKNIIYFFETEHFLREDRDYVLTITNLKTGKIVSSTTNLIHDLNLMSSLQNPSYKLGLYNSGDFNNTTIEWDHSTNAAIYQMSIRVNYSEYSLLETVEKSITQVFPIILYNGNSNIKQTIDGEVFFSFLENNIPIDNTVINRRINNIDLLFSAGSSILNTYINLNEPPSGIVQERPIYTNIDNGIGLFSCRYNKSSQDVREEDLHLTNTTKEAIVNQLKNLNFIL